MKATVKARKYTIKWKKNAKADGYQVQYKVKKGSYSNLKKSVTKNKAVSKKLTAGKQYIFRVRTYKKINGKKVYGKWTVSKAVKCK